MRRLLFCLSVILLTGSPAGVGSAADALSVPGLEQPAVQQAQPGNGFLVKLRDQFTDGELFLSMIVVLLAAIFLGAAIAYHPLVRSKASTITEIEQPKTFIMYALVGAVVGQIVLVNSVMGFVIFGLGGLLRFRTDVGEAKDTGRVILAALVGVCCGLEMFAVAVVATVLGWGLIWYLESQVAGRVQVKGLDSGVIPKAAEAYRGALQSAGCRILGEKKNFVKGQVTFVFRAPRGLDRDQVEAGFADIPKELRGGVDWAMS